jgi:cell division protein FtsN
VRVQVLEEETKQLLARMGVASEPQRMGRQVNAGSAAATAAYSVNAQSGTGVQTASVAMTGATVTAPVAAAGASTEAQATSTSPKGGWVVQLGSFSTRQSAESVVEQSFINVPSRIQEADVGGRKFYRAQLGPFSEREEAERVRQEMLNAGITGAMVMVDR